MKHITPPLQPGPGTQPIRFLHPYILGYFEHASRDMPELFREQIKYAKAPSQIAYNIAQEPAVGPYIDQNGKIHLQETFLSFLWAISYASLVIFDEMVARPQLEPNYSRTEQQEGLINDAMSLFDYGLSLDSTYTHWDLAVLPNPEIWSEAENIYVEKSGLVFLQATVFIMLHEFGHFYLGHLERDAELLNQNMSLSSEESRAQEQNTDNFATQTMMSGADWHVNRESVTCGIVIGLCAILFLHPSLDGGDHHPDPHRRLHRALVEMELEANNTLWAVASVALAQWAHYHLRPIPGGNTYDTYRENFELIMDQLEDPRYYQSQL